MLNRKKELLEIIHKAQAEYKLLDAKEHEESFDTDWIFLDNFEDARIAFDGGDKKTLFNKVSAMWDRLKSRKLLDIDYSPVSLLTEWFQKETFVKMPERFGDDIKLPIANGLVILGAQTGRGKTTGMVNWIDDCINNEKTCVVFSIEESREALYSRLLQVHFSYMGHADYGFYDIPRFFKSEMQEPFSKFLERSKKFCLIIESGGITAREICGMYERAKNYFAGEPDFTFIDYIQEIETDHDNRKYLFREQHILNAKIIKDKAKLSKSIWVCLSQLNKDNDVSESRHWEKHASTIMRIEKEEKSENPDDFILNFVKGRYSGTSKKYLKINLKSGLIGEKAKQDKLI